MIRRIYPYSPADLELIELQPGQKEMREFINKEFAESLSCQTSFTMWVDGKALACLGAYPCWPGNRAMGWAMMSNDIGRHLIWLTRRARHFFDTLDFDRIEMLIKSDFENAGRWARMLGFENDTPNHMRKWGPNGDDYDLYSRVR